MSTPAIPDFTNEMLDANFRYIAQQLNRQHRHIRHLEGHLVDFSKQLEDTTKATVILSKKALARKNRRALIVAGVVVGYYAYKNRHRVQIVLDNANTGAKMRHTEPEKFADYTTRQKPDDNQPQAEAPDTTL